jgi:hypothetical protein
MIIHLLNDQKLQATGVPAPGSFILPCSSSLKMMMVPARMMKPSPCPRRHIFKTSSRDAWLTFNVTGLEALSKELSQMNANPVCFRISANTFSSRRFLPEILTRCDRLGVAKCNAMISRENAMNFITNGNRTGNGFRGALPFSLNGIF